MILMDYVTAALAAAAIFMVGGSLTGYVVCAILFGGPRWYKRKPPKEPRRFRDRDWSVEEVVTEWER